MTEAEKDILKQIQQFSGRHSPYTVFSDWMTMLALSIANTCTMIHGKTWQEREEWYEATKKKYTDKEFQMFAEMTAYLIEALDEEMTDVLGGVFMQSGAGNGRLGQFFTPFHLSELCARLGFDESMLTDDGRKLKVNEPSSGGGSMVIAVAKTLKDRGINYQRKMEVVAQDLDWLGVFMSYIQFSFLGIDAIVVQGDTLTEPYIQGYPENRILRTPRNMGALIL